MKKLLLMLALVAIATPSPAQQAAPQPQKMYTVSAPLEFWQASINLAKSSKAPYETVVSYMDYLTAQLLPQLQQAADTTHTSPVNTGDTIKKQQAIKK